MADYRLEPLNEENTDRWDDFNNRSPHGSLFHSRRWKRIVESSFPCRRHYFLLLDGESVIGLFPFIEQNTRLFRGIVAEKDPFRVYALLKDNLDPSAMEYAIEGLRSMKAAGKSLSYAWISVLDSRRLQPIPSGRLLPWSDDGVMVLDLAQSPPSAIWDTFSRKRRKRLRWMERDGFMVSVIMNKEELSLFYRTYEANVRHIGGTVSPFSFFSDQWDAFADTMRITVLTRGSTVAGGLLTHLDPTRKTAYFTHLSLNRQLPNAYSPSYYLYWEGINWAWENHYDRISFGGQRYDAENMRYRVKYTMGARFVPIHTKIVPLTSLYSLATRGMNFLRRGTGAAADTVPHPCGGIAPSPAPSRPPSAIGGRRLHHGITTEARTGSILDPPFHVRSVPVPEDTGITAPEATPSTGAR